MLILAYLSESHLSFTQLNSDNKTILARAQPMETKANESH
jgi:hypothetical protein